MPGQASHASIFTNASASKPLEAHHQCCRLLRQHVNNNSPVRIATAWYDAALAFCDQAACLHQLQKYQPPDYFCLLQMQEMETTGR
jgi:hypothetical protein